MNALVVTALFNSPIEQNAQQLGSDLGHNGWSQLRPIIEFHPYTAVEINLHCCMLKDKITVSNF